MSRRDDECRVLVGSLGADLLRTMAKRLDIEGLVDDTNVGLTRPHAACRLQLDEALRVHGYTGAPLRIRPSAIGLDYVYFNADIVDESNVQRRIDDLDRRNEESDPPWP